MTTALNGFKKTSTWPVNLAMFNDSDYAPSETTDRQLADHCLQPAALEGLHSAVHISLQQATSASHHVAIPTSLQPAASGTQIAGKSKVPIHSILLTPEDIVPNLSCKDDSKLNAFTVDIYIHSLVRDGCNVGNVTIRSTAPMQEKRMKMQNQCICLHFASDSPFIPYLGPQLAPPGGAR
ncbi:hypothetical protein J6590_096511 [Homalodisca vitripennis]|nr:hypothetical protein J6590_096511 [Homalodisca vitripennis]